MDIGHLQGKQITLVVGNIGIKGRLKEIKKEYILLESVTMDIYVDPDKVVYVSVEKEDQEEGRILH